MYGATGKLANKVYYRANGQTIAREAVTPKNPRTNLQTLQRVIAKQVNDSYKKFKDVCDHSFENVTTGAPCMNRFKKLNMRSLRSRASEINQAGMSLAQFYNFQPVGSTKWVPGVTILAQGQLQKIAPFVGHDELGLYMGGLSVAENTYAGIAAACGAKRGDQLTFITVEKIADEYQVRKARVILDPRESDGTSAPMSTAFVDASGIVKPNWKNSGKFTVLEFDTDELHFTLGPNGSTLVACAIINSRKEGDNWLYSNAELVVSEDACGSDAKSLYDAMEESYGGEDIDLEADLYLHNAGEGGNQGSASGGGAPSTDPSYNNTVSINGVSQNIAGGSATVTAPLTSIVISGTALAEAPVTGRASGASEDVTPTKTATTITFSGLNIAAGGTFTVKKNGSTWFTVTAAEAGSDDPEPGDDQD